MGDSKKKRDKFKEKHPICYFCGFAPMMTIDHVPARECFKDRVGPEEFEFPACEQCNRQSSQLEQAVSLYLILGNHSGEEPSAAQMRRLAMGVKNNNPELLPTFEIGARKARSHFKEKGLKLNPGQTYAEVPLIELPIGNREAFEVFSRRLTCALYYKELGKRVSLDDYIGVAWSHIQDPGSMTALEGAQALFPNLRMSSRSNTSIGDQFSYFWGYNPDEGVFGFTEKFSESYLFFGSVCGPSDGERNENWKLHRSDILWLD